MTSSSSVNQPPNQTQQLINSAVRFLGFRPRSQQEIATYLSRKTSDSAQINAAIEFLQEQKLIDDHQFTTWFIESRLHQKPRGPKIISYELKKYGVDSKIINQHLAQISFSTWEQAAIFLLQKKASKLHRLPPRQFRAKAYQLLFSKGFPGEIIDNAIDEFTSQE